MMRKTKIVCTLGPATEDVAVLARLLEAGMNVARFNMAHGTHEYHAAMIGRLREASRATGIPAALLIDIKGPEVRTGAVPGGGTVELRTASEVVLTVDDAPCTAERISISYMDLPEQASPGHAHPHRRRAHRPGGDGRAGPGDALRRAHRRQARVAQERQHHRREEQAARRHRKGRGQPPVRRPAGHGFRGGLVRPQARGHPGDPPDSSSPRARTCTSSPRSRTRRGWRTSTGSSAWPTASWWPGAISACSSPRRRCRSCRSGSSSSATIRTRRSSPPRRCWTR